MNKLSIVVPIVVSIAALTGCSDDPIKIVEDSYTPYEKTMTIGKILNTRTVCNRVTWEKFIDNRDRTIVEYRCYLNGAPELYQGWKQDSIENVRVRLEEAIKNVNKLIKSNDQSSMLDYWKDEVVRTEERIMDLESNAPDYTDVYEVVQWSFDKDNNAIFQYAGVQFVGAYKEDRIWNYSSYEQFIDVAIDNSRSDIIAYARFSKIPLSEY